LESCIPTRDGHFYSLEIISAYNPTGKSILLSEQHHLCLITLTSYMPVSLFSHTQRKRPYSSIITDPSHCVNPLLWYPM